jgi:hypothetical protein
MAIPETLRNAANLLTTHGSKSSGRRTDKCHACRRKALRGKPCTWQSETSHASQPRFQKGDSTSNGFKNTHRLQYGAPRGLVADSTDLPESAAVQRRELPEPLDRIRSERIQQKPRKRPRHRKACCRIPCHLPPSAEVRVLRILQSMNVAAKDCFGGADCWSAHGPFRDHRERPLSPRTERLPGSGRGRRGSLAQPSAEPRGGPSAARDVDQCVAGGGVRPELRSEWLLAGPPEGFLEPF